MGVTSKLRPGWLKTLIVAGLVALAVPAVFFMLGARKKLDAEGWVFLLIMPGRAKELVFRRVCQSLLNGVFGKPWRVADAEFGCGMFITAILFAGSNGLVAVDAQLHARIVLQAEIAPFLLRLVSGWIRERTDSVWPCVFGHNLSNVVLPLPACSDSGTLQPEGSRVLGIRCRGGGVREASRVVRLSPFRFGRT